MTSKFGLILLLFALLIAACESPRIYTLEELERNNYNDLQLRVSPAIGAEDFEQIFKELGELNSEQILTKLSTENLELNEVSFCFYYLANSYAAAGDIEQAIKYHRIAAHQYINPQSLLKLAELNFFRDKNYARAYEYLHQSLEVKVEITENNRSHPLAKNGKIKAQHLLEELEKLGKDKVFDKEAVREKLKAELPVLLDNYRAIYGLGAKEEG